MKKIYQKIRRLSAVFLAVSMVCGMVWPGNAFSMTAYASTELPSENLGDGASDTLGYKWKPALPCRQRYPVAAAGRGLQTMENKDE